MNKIIVHIDLNAFFVRCEELKNPSLEGKPVIIGHSGRSGIVSTCSYEARKQGVSSGMPTFKALKCCPNAILIDCDFEYYHKKSDEFFSFLYRYTNKIEIASIDECYLDFTNVLSSVSDQYGYLLNLQMTLKKQTGLNCSIGVAPTKFLAKMGSDMLKPNGITFLFNYEDLEKKLYPLPIDDFWGIGKKSAPRLKDIGIKTIKDLVVAIESGDEKYRRHLGKFYYLADDWLHFRGDNEINLSEWDPKSIGMSTTLMKDCSSFEEIKTQLLDLCSNVSSKLKDKKKRGQTISLVVKDTGFRLHNKSITIDLPTDNEDTIFTEASRLYKENFDGLLIRLIGVTVSHFAKKINDEEVLQMDFWNYESFEINDKTNKLVRELNKNLSKPMLIKASDLKKGKNGNK